LELFEMVRNGPWLVLLMISVVGCGKPFDYQPVSEIPKGPGIFSDKGGGFTLYSNDKEKQQAPTTKSASSAAPEDFREFQDYQEFQRWKATAKDNPEYREFQDWREWKAYRAWKGQQSK
jgi:hypothetical protein